MLQSFMMVLREGFESFLIVAIITSYLKTTQRPRLIPAVYVAVVLSLFLSAGLGYVLMTGVNQALWEGILGLVAAVMVTSLVIHMWRIGPKMKQNIQASIDKASLEKTSKMAWFGVFIFTVLMISREGMETALMLIQVRDGEVIGGILLGLFAAGLMALLWIKYAALINIKRFFQVTGIFLMLFVVQVLIYSAHEFSESGLIPNSEAFHEATEPFSPMGTYGQWFSAAMIGVCALWLAIGWFRDHMSRRLQSQKPVEV